MFIQLFAYNHFHINYWISGRITNSSRLLVILSKLYQWKFCCCIKHIQSIWYGLAQNLASKQPSYSVYSSLCTFISSITAVEDSHCYFLKHINSDVHWGSVLPSTLIVWFINLSKMSCPIHSYTDDSTLHFSTSFHRWPTQQELDDSKLESPKHLTTDLTIISNWGKKNLLSFNISKTWFLHQSSQHTLPNAYHQFFDNTQLSPSPTL